MVFDPLGTLTRGRFYGAGIITSKMFKVHWTGPPTPVPSTWVPHVNSSQEAQVLRLLKNSSLATRYAFFSNVPLTELFSSDARAFLQVYRTIKNYTGLDPRTLRRSAFRALNSHIGLKAVDILVCDRKTHTLVAGLEIDGSHHWDYGQQVSDLSKSLLFARHGLPLLRIAARAVSPQINWTTLHQLLAQARKRWQLFVVKPDIQTLQLHLIRRSQKITGLVPALRSGGADKEKSPGGGALGETRLAPRQ